MLRRAIVHKSSAARNRVAKQVTQAAVTRRANSAEDVLSAAALLATEAPTRVSDDGSAVVDITSSRAAALVQRANTPHSALRELNATSIRRAQLPAPALAGRADSVVPAVLTDGESLFAVLPKTESPPDPVHQTVSEMLTGARLVLSLMMRRTTVAELRRYIFVRLLRERSLSATTMAKSNGSGKDLSAVPLESLALHYANSFVDIAARTSYIGFQTVGESAAVDDECEAELVQMRDLRAMIDDPSRGFDVHAVVKDPMVASYWPAARAPEIFAQSHPGVTRAFEKADDAITAGAMVAVEGLPHASFARAFAWDPSRMAAFFRSPPTRLTWTRHKRGAGAFGSLLSVLTKSPSLVDALMLSPAVALMAQACDRQAAGAFNATRLDMQQAQFGFQFFHYRVIHLMADAGSPVTVAALSATVDSELGPNAPLIPLSQLVADLAKNRVAISVHPRATVQDDVVGAASSSLGTARSAVAYLLFGRGTADAVDAGRSMIICDGRLKWLQGTLCRSTPFLNSSAAGNHFDVGCDLVRCVRDQARDGGLVDFAPPRRFTDPSIVGLLATTGSRCRKRRVSAHATAVPVVLAEAVVDVSMMADAAGWTFELGRVAGVVAMRRFLEMSAVHHPSVVRVLRADAGRPSGHHVTLSQAENESLLRFARRASKSRGRVVLVDAGSGLIFAARVPS